MLVAAPLRICWCNSAFADLELPECTRAAIDRERVADARHRQFPAPGPPLGRLPGKCHGICLSSAPSSLAAYSQHESGFKTDSPGGSPCSKRRLPTGKAGRARPAHNPPRVQSCELLATCGEVFLFPFLHFGHFHSFEFVSDFGFPVPPVCVHHVSAVYWAFRLDCYPAALWMPWLPKICRCKRSRLCERPFCQTNPS